MILKYNKLRNEKLPSHHWDATLRICEKVLSRRLSLLYVTSIEFTSPADDNQARQRQFFSLSSKIFPSSFPTTEQTALVCKTNEQTDNRNGVMKE